MDSDGKQIMKKYGPFAFAIIAAGIFLYFLLFRGEVLGAVLGKIGAVLAPIIYGFVIAYALNPQMRLIEKGILLLLKKCKKKPARKGLMAVRIISTILAVLILLLVVYSLIALMIPEIIKSIENIRNNLSVYGENIEKWIASFGGGQDAAFKEMIDNAVAAIQSWVSEQVSPEMDEIVKQVTSSVLDILVFFKNIFLGLIVSVYVLITQETILARFRRATYAVFNVAVANRFLKNLRFIDEKFGGFLIGKFIDSLIIGIICYIGVRILQMPYALLIAVVIGITNIIPFFGPFIGAIPCAFLIFCVDPIKAIYFIIFIFALQQFDGNFLGPKILGNSVGVSTFMVLVAILIGSGFFGIVGMVIGVPICAVLTALIQTYILKQIGKKNLPGKLDDYRKMDHVDPWSRSVVRFEDDTEDASFYHKLKARPRNLEGMELTTKENPWDLTDEDVETDRLLFQTELEADREYCKKAESIDDSNVSDAVDSEGKAARSADVLLRSRTRGKK